MLFEGVGGWLRVTVGELVSTVNVTGALLPSALPIELGWPATAVYWPLVSAGLALLELQPAPVPGAVAVDITAPSAFAPA